jgi:toxin ParE1/3/4
VKIRWTPEAREDRRQIWAYIAAENPIAASQLDQRFSEVVQSLTDYPEIGRQGLIPGTLELIPHENYRIVYQIVADTAWILAVVHAARQWPLVTKSGE